MQALSERAAEVHSGSVDPSVDNMLKITSDGRKIGLDQRLMNSALPDDPNSKLNACVNNVLRIWNDTKEQKLTQLIFCDMSTPKGDGSFNVYDDIRTKLLNAGVPEQEIEFIHNADTENKNGRFNTAYVLDRNTSPEMRREAALLAQKELAECMQKWGITLLDAPVPEQMKYDSLAEAASHLMQVLNDPEHITG